MFLNVTMTAVDSKGHYLQVPQHYFLKIHKDDHFEKPAVETKNNAGPPSSNHDS